MTLKAPTEHPAPKTREELLIDMGLLVDALCTIANLTQDRRVMQEVDGVFKAIGLPVGGDLS